MKKWLFQSQDYIGFLFGIISGFGINLITGKLADLGVLWGIISVLCGTAGFFLYKFWISTKDEFDFYITHGVWEKKFFDNVYTWICKDTDEYQLVEGDTVVKPFHQPWTKIFPDNENNESFRLFLKRNGIIVRQFTWLYADGGRVLMPIPKSRNLKPSNEINPEYEYFFQKDSLEYRMLYKIGEFGSENSFERLLERAKIKIV